MPYVPVGPRSPGPAEPSRLVCPRCPRAGHSPHGPGLEDARLLGAPAVLDPPLGLLGYVEVHAQVRVGLHAAHDLPEAGDLDLGLAGHVRRAELEACPRAVQLLLGEEEREHVLAPLARREGRAVEDRDLRGLREELPAAEHEHARVGHLPAMRLELHPHLELAALVVVEAGALLPLGHAHGAVQVRLPHARVRGPRHTLQLLQGPLRVLDEYKHFAHLVTRGRAREVGLAHVVGEQEDGHLGEERARALLAH
mmetsp:Transcript_11653/g.39814  ORF Transcript_11653/g.39814 Transcript_11653/m.39814 type:complete len:253 (-) Transcript_11653:97-855(-)